MANEPVNVADYYSTIDTAFAFGNDETDGVTEYAQFNTIVTNKFYTPDNDTVPEDLQFRVSKAVKFYLGSNDTSENADYSMAISDSESLDSLTLGTMRETMNFSAQYLALGGITINETAAATKMSTNKLLQLHSGNKMQMLGQAEFQNETKFEKNVYIGQSLIFQQSNYGGESNEQVRIAFQYNQGKDTLDIVKQKGNGVNASKRLMARLGLGSVLGSHSDLDNVPYYQSTPVSAAYNANAPVFDATNIFKQTGNILYYGTGLNERVGIGSSNVSLDDVLFVSGQSRYNDIIFDDGNNISGVNNLGVSTANINTLNVATALNIQSNVNFDVAHINVTKINFKDHGDVNEFNGNISSLHWDKYTWLEDNVADIPVSSFNNDVGLLSNLNAVPVKSKWRFQEVGDDLLVEKYDGTSWVTKFRFKD